MRDILEAAGFVLKRTRGSHEQWQRTNGDTKYVTVDAAVSQFSVDRIKSMIAQSGLTRDQFYRQTDRTARKINKRPLG